MRKICVVVGSRANYSSIKSVMSAVRAHPALELQVVVGASALLDRFGSVVDVVKELQSITGYRNRIQHAPPKSGELRNVVMSINKIHEEMGWNPITHLKMGLITTVRAWKQPLTVWNEPRGDDK